MNPHNQEFAYRFNQEQHANYIEEARQMQQVQHQQPQARTTKRRLLSVGMGIVMMVSVGSTGVVPGTVAQTTATAQADDIVKPYDHCNGGENLFQAPSANDAPSLNQC